MIDTDNDQRVRAEVLQKLATEDSFNHQNLKFLLKIGDEVEEVMGYAKLCDAMEKQTQDEIDHPDKFWTFTKILAH